MNLQGFSDNVKERKINTAGAKLYAVSAVAILVSVAVGIFVVWPKISQALELRKANEELIVRSEAISEKVRVLESFDSEELEDQLVSSELMLPSKKTVFSFVQQIENISAISGVFLEQVDIVPGSLEGVEDNGAALPQVSSQEDRKSAVSPSLQIKVSTTSSYSSFLTFVKFLFSVVRITDISDLTISTEDAGSSALNTSFIIEAYWKSLPSELGPIEEPIEPLTLEELSLIERAQISESSASATPALLDVPLGRDDLFTPF